MTDRPADMKRARMLSGILLLVVFLAGSLTGAVATDGSSEPVGVTAVARTASPGLSGLDLSPGQQERIDAILAESQPITDSIIQASMRDVRAVMAGVNAEIRAVLSPDQIEAFEAMLSSGPQVRAVRRTLGPDGEVVESDTIR